MIKRKRYYFNVGIFIDKFGTGSYDTKYIHSLIYRDNVNLNNIKSYLESRFKGIEVIANLYDDMIDVCIIFNIKEMDEVLLGIYKLDKDKFYKKVCYGINTHI